MKSVVFILVLLIAPCAKIMAQDSLILIDKQVIECRAGSVSIHNSEIEYSKWGSTNNATYAIKKSLVYLIRYNTGMIDTINYPYIPSETGVRTKIKMGDLGGNPLDSSTYLDGYYDGTALQDGLGPALAGGVAAVGCGLCGIAVPIGYSTSKISPLKIPAEINRSKSNEYQRGLLEGMEKKRSRSAWTGYALGFLPSLGFLIYMYYY